jgi:ankyrin repeat protein
MNYRISVLVMGHLAVAFAQIPEKVDFSRDVLPILRQNCTVCHGPTQQISGMRVDRRSSMMKAIDRRIIPGNSGSSRLFLRLSGSEFGPQMPPTGALPPDQIATIRKWIDQGANWPDALANEVELPPVDSKAVALVEMLRSGDSQRFMATLKRNPKLLNARGPGGGTPLHYTALYGTPAMMETLIRMGAEVNARNDANATPLLWAATDLGKTRVLLRHGADVNARSDDMRTPLMSAARRPGNEPVVRLLLEHGANPNPNAHPARESSPLTEAATAGDGASMELLVSRGADAKAAGQPALAMTIVNRCANCRNLLVGKGLDKEAYTGALQETAVLIDADSLRVLLDRGADIDAFDPLGRTPLMYAAGSDLIPTETVRTLIEHGANVNARNKHQRAGDEGLTVLDIARFRGNTPVVDLLVRAGAESSGDGRKVQLTTLTKNTVQSAILRSVPLIQAADAGFTPKSACISCHNDSLSEMAVNIARQRGIRVNEQIANQQVNANRELLEKIRERLYQGYFVQVEDNFGADILGYMLIALGGFGYKADLNTDAVSIYIRARQAADGHWENGRADTRPPLGSSFIEQTVLAMRSLQLYPLATAKADYAYAVKLAANWIAEAEPSCNDDLASQVMGLAWAGTQKAALDRAIRRLAAAQRADGGWSDLRTMESTAYATGKALYALHIAGISGPLYERGIQYLLRTQQPDGSWYVKTRALAFQPYFESGFPYGYDQWISAAATSWATMALTASMPPSQSAQVWRQ